MSKKYTNLSFPDRGVFKHFYFMNIKEVAIYYDDIFYYYDLLTPALNYSLRIFYFFKLIYFFKFSGFNSTLILKTFSMELQNYWFIFLHNYSVKNYINLCVFLIRHYYKNYKGFHHYVKTTRFIVRPSTFLVYNNFKVNSNKSWCNSWNIYKTYLINNDKASLANIFSKLRQSRFWNLQFNASCDSNFSSAFIISFLRVQRRYNKRRYSRVRAYSRAPFFSGISLSSLLVSSFFNSNIKNVDWSTSLPVVIDVNFILFFTLVYFFFRFWKIISIMPLLRSRGRLHIIKSFNKLVVTQSLRNLFVKFIK